MFKDSKFIKQFTDMMSEGFIFIDTFGKIQIYNRKAKEIFGIAGHEGIGHDGGKVEKGDIVIIGTNCLGKDDGNLKSKDLACLGVREKNIPEGNALIAVGVVEDEGVTPVYKFGKLASSEEGFQLNTTFLNQKIQVEVNNKSKYVTIEVNGEVFFLSFMQAIGHMVVLDEGNKKAKFYQTKGYTARKESVGELLRGKSYRGKGKDLEDFPVIGKKIFDVHSDNTTIKEFYEVAKGENHNYEERFTEINGRPTICTLKPININGQREGAVLKVEDISEIRKAIRERDEAILHLEQMEELLHEQKYVSKLFPEIVGESEAMNQVKQLAYKASKSNSTVVILGESGTGKSILAKAIHKAGKHKEEPFIYVNSGSIPEDLLESELFGYEGGAFTGAKQEGKAGMFELADGGTIFLDEIGEMTPSVQVKLLQVLQNKSFYRIGGSRRISVDVRIIAATNKNLEEEMEKGRFREDLYYRINVFPIWIPTLWERKEDIHGLVYNLLPRICSRIGCGQKRISGEALQKLTEYHWPGNVRELENVLERAVNLAEGDTIVSKHLIIGIKKTSSTVKAVNIKSIKEAVAIAEKKTIEEALTVYGGNKREAMKALEIGKTSFYEKLKKYNIKY